ncbi:MAG: beta-propeller domain-containing protein [Nocardioides sp.]
MTGSRRAGLATAAVAALGTSFVAGMVVAGGTTTPPTGPPTQPPVNAPIRLANADLRLPGSCEALLASYIERGAERVGPYGWDSPVYYAMEDGMFAAGEDSAGAVDAEPMPAPGESPVVEQGSSATGTNVQEVGVDEPDVVKTDGELLVRVLEEDVALYDVTGSEPVELGEIDLPSEVDTAELLLAGDSLVVVGSIESGDAFGDTRLLTYDVTDPASPALVDDRGFDSTLVRAVQHDDDVRLVLNGGLPDLDFVQPRFWRDSVEATERNREVVRDSTIEDWLPTVTTYDADGDGEPIGTEPLLDCAEVTVPDSDDAALGTIAVLGFDADDPSDADVLGVATDTRLAYFSPTRMYLATSAWSTWGCCWDGMPVSGHADDGRSRLYAFELDGTDATYVASGVVDGVIEDRWSMDEHDGVLRVAVGPSQQTGNFNSVLLLRQDGDDLEEVGRVDKLGVGEDIKSVRWFDSLAIVVTFRQVDPLYAIDLADPEEPVLLGELKIPGFSEYLHPISGDRLIGLGQDASLSGMLRGAQAAVFDVADLTDPRRTDVVTYRKGSVAAAAADPRQFTWLPDAGTALTVVSQGWEGRTGWVSVLTVEGGTLSNRMVEVEYGTDVDSVRLVPLPDGRVVLTTGEDVSFFEV